MRLNDALRIGGAALALALAGAACGTTETPSVAGAGSATTTTSSSLAPATGGRGTSNGGGGKGGVLSMAGGGASTMRKFASCMRAHGVTNFPDPSADGTITFRGVNPNSPAFSKAQRACRKYTPNGGRPPSPAQQAAAQKAALAFSACMRSHGVPKFPDPQFSGGGASLRIGPSNGIDPKSPTFQAAQRACQKDLPGTFKTQSAAP